MSSAAMSERVNDQSDVDGADEPSGSRDSRDLRAAQAGDAEAFGQLYDRHAAVVRALCRHRAFSADEAEADDACQETFIRAYRLLDKFDHEAQSQRGGFRAWLYAIARHVCAERRRANRRRIKYEDAAMKNGALMLIDRGTHSNALADEQLEHLTHALDQLEERERLAIHLHYLDADPVLAAEQALGLSRSGYYKLLARARARLAALMSAQASRDQGFKTSRGLS